jgi:hypothetical protein
MVILFIDLGSQGSTFCARCPNLYLPVVRAALAEHGEGSEWELLLLYFLIWAATIQVSGVQI